MFAETDEQARGLCVAFTGDRQGYANTRSFLDVDGKFEQINVIVE